MRAPVRRYAHKGCAVGVVRLRRVKQISLARPIALTDAHRADRLHDLAAAPSEKAPSERTYAIGRGPAAKIEMLAIDRLGRITTGSFSGIRIGDLMQTAAKQGWLAWRCRADGWYAAEWCPERKTIGLCGQCASPRSARSALAGPSRDGAPENSLGHVDVEDRPPAATTSLLGDTQHQSIMSLSAPFSTPLPFAIGHP